MNVIVGAAQVQAQAQAQSQSQSQAEAQAQTQAQVQAQPQQRVKAKRKVQGEEQEHERWQTEAKVQEKLQALSQTETEVRAKSDSRSQRELFTKSALVLEKRTTKEHARNRKLLCHLFNLGIPTFDSKEIVLGKLLGRGSFSDVLEIRNFTIHEGVTGNRAFETSASTDQHNNIDNAEQHHNQAPSFLNDESRKFIVDHCIRGKSDDARYAVKCLRKVNTKTNKSSLHSGVMDIIVEAGFLSRIQHPNIIKLRAMSNCLNPAENTANIATTNISNYFLILDRLKDTLRSRILQWKEQKRKMTTLVSQILASFPSRSRYRAKKLALLDQRLAAAFDLSAAVKYIHEKKIIHRDIKPENIGFDIRGDIKLFDFGLARQLRDKDVAHYCKRTETKLYHLSRMTGSLRYMAPEVVLGKPYNEKCDVYSLSIVIWEMLALERAYSSSMIMAPSRASTRTTACNISESSYAREDKHNKDKDDENNKSYEQQFIDNIIVNGIRPPIKDKWSMTLKDLFICGWHNDYIDQRHSAATIQDLLFVEILKIREDNSGDLRDHESRRSTYIFENDVFKQIKSWCSTNSSVAADDINNSLSSHGHCCVSAKSAISGGSRNSRGKLPNAASLN